jgi:hypothetical protein
VPAGLREAVDTAQDSGRPVPGRTRAPEGQVRPHDRLPVSRSRKVTLDFARSLATYVWTSQPSPALDSAHQGAWSHSRQGHGTRYIPIPYNSPMDYLYAALIFAFMVAVLVVLWKREHPKKD